MSRVFGQSMGKKRGASGSSSSYQRQFGGKNAGHSKRDAEKSEEEILAERRAQYRRQKYEEGEALDISFGYARYDHKSEEKSKRGWIFNMLPTVRCALFEHDSFDVMWWHTRTTLLSLQGYVLRVVLTHFLVSHRTSRPFHRRSIRLTKAQRWEQNFQPWICTFGPRLGQPSNRRYYILPIFTSCQHGRMIMTTKPLFSNPSCQA
jgi:hypothetical protein